MKTPTKLGTYAAVLVAVLAAGAGVGAAVGPLDDGEDAEMSHEMNTPTTTVVTTPEEGSDMPAGLSASEAGYTFTPDETTFAAGAVEAFTFRVLGPDGSAVTDFDTRHDKDLHVVVVSDDLGRLSAPPPDARRRRNVERQARPAPPGRLPGLRGLRRRRR